MTHSILTALAGIGLFLLGMALMTEGLRALAGDRLRGLLRRSTETTGRAVLAGILVTAVLQSSSATTVAVVGFVGAGLMRFEQALGIIFGANIGTTLTGWIVAILGVRLDLASALAPAVFAGVLGIRFGRGRVAQAGRAVAGFGLLFLGIATLQSGLSGTGGLLSPERFPADTLAGRAELVLLGIVATIVTQSSSAGVAAAVTALGAQAITFPQGAAMVIGMDVGTTASAALAAIGGTTAARRTGLAHVIYNALTGAMAFALLWPVGWLFDRLHPDPAIALVAFHSGFNILGVLLIVGLTRPFARLVVALVPARGPDLTRRLDASLLSDPDVAGEAALATTRDVAGALFRILGDLLTGERVPAPAAVDTIAFAIDETRHFAERIRPPADRTVFAVQIETLHCLDHLARLLNRCRQQDRVEALRQDDGLAADARSLAASLPSLDPGRAAEEAERANAERRAIRDDRDGTRAAFIRDAAGGRLSADALTARLDAARWLHRSSYHVWRIAHHLAAAGPGTPPP